MNGISRAMVRIEGISPLLMHNAQLANPQSEIVQQMKEITKKHHTKKTESDELKLMELEYYGGMYFHEAHGPYIPGVNIEGSIRDAARSSRQGKHIESGMSVEQEVIPLDYDGPRTMAQLYSDKRFVDVRPVKLQKSSTIMRTRPRFDQWSAEFEIMAIDEIVSMKDVEKFLSIAGMMKGICDYRPKFGKFKLVEFEEV